MSDDRPKHLSSEEISRRADEALEGGPRAVLANDEVAEHLFACARCKRLLAGHVNIANQLHRLEVEMSAPPSAECPPDEKWLELAGGLLASSEAQRLSLHAAECDHCGPLLRAAVEDFSSELPDADRTLLAQLPIATKEGQQHLTNQLANECGPSAARAQAPTARGGWRRFLMPWREGNHGGWFTFLPAGVTVAALAAALITAIQSPAWFGASRSKGDIDRLLAAAYSANRQIELRIPGAEYAPLATNRAVSQAAPGRLYSEGQKLGAPGAPEQNRFVDQALTAEQEPIPLQKAGGEIADHLGKSPEDAYWLRAQAVAEVLRQHPRAAIQILLKLQASQRDSPQLMNDLATAYYAQWQHTNDATDVSEALNWIARAYQATIAKPDPAIVFNYALVLEKAGLKESAKQLWKQYLDLDKSSPWAEEARSHLAAVSELIQQHHVAPFSASGPSEPYLDDAVTSWLPAAFPQAGAPDRSAQDRLELLSTLLINQHQDDWLFQLLNGKGPGFSRGIAELSAAASDNTAGRHQSAQQHATKAEKVFAAIGNRAGATRSRYEQVYALDRLAQGKPCRQASQALAAQLVASQFHWLEVQNLLALNSCAQIAGFPLPEAAELPKISELAKGFGYSSLELRAEGFLADNAAAQNVPGDCIRVSLRGLASYWATPYEKPARAYNFYQALAELAEASASWELAYDFNRESALVFQSGTYPLQAALAWTHAAQAASALGRTADARAALATSGQLLQQVAEPATVGLYSADNALWAAQLFLQQNQVEAARHSLELASQLLRRNPTTGEVGVDDYNVTLPYYTLQARIALAQRQWSEATNSLVAALKEAEADRSGQLNYHDRLMWTREVGGIYRELVALDLDGLQSPEKALLDWEHYRAIPEQAGGDMQNAGAPFAHLLAASSHSKSVSTQPEFFLTFVVTPERTAALLLGEDGSVHGGWCPGSAKQIQDAERNFRSSLASPSANRSDLRGQAEALNRTLLGSVGDTLPQGAILIIQPDDGAGEIPFYALMDQQGRYLAERFTVVVAPHTPDSWQLPDPRGLPATSPALVVRAEQPPGLRTLGDLRPEVDAVRTAYPHTTELAGTAASRAQIMNDLPRAALFHFAGHSYEMPDSADLLLATGEIAGPDAVTQTDTSRLQLAVLSACSTGRSRFAARDDESLLGAFLARGVPYVIATDWDVNSQVTTTYMQALYRHLGQGSWVGEAVRLADLDMLKGKDTQSPFYWAGFKTYASM